jgi:two-component system sensor histidine kinase DegS
LEDLGLVLAVRQMAEEAAARAGIMLDLAITDNIPALSPDTEQCIFRVAQEAITNVLKHARAKTLTVRLEFKEGKVTLMVRDDGGGFDVKANSEGKHFGLLGMKERVQFVKGELHITSRPGKGTTVQLTV